MRFVLISSDHAFFSVRNMLCELRVLFLVFVVRHCYCLENNTDGCDADSSCLRCGPSGCIKCPDLIVHPTRKCVTICPYGHIQKWSTMADYMGRVCVPSSNFLGLSNDTLAIVTGISAGALICVVIIAVAVAYVKYKRKAEQNSVETSSDLDDSPERKDFLKQLETLRPYAQDFLDMLNDTRRQVRELHRQGDNGAIGAYKPVVRDLAKILLLLNKPTERAAVPEDWEHLFSWAEKTLKRCKKDTAHPQVAQLINFLQEPETEPDYSVRCSTTMSTFKPERNYGSSLSLQDAAVQNFNSNYDSTCHGPLNPQWKFEYSLVSSSSPVSSSQFNPMAWKNSKEYLSNSYFLDDDFCQLGFRPQDEITTEL